MSAFILVFAIFACITGLFGRDVRAYVRKQLAARKEQTPLLPERQRQLAAAEWLDVFRETVVAAEGEVSPDLDAFLSSVTARDQILAAAAKERDHILAAAEKERDCILADAERSRVEMLDRVVNYSDEEFAALLYDELRLQWHRLGFALPVEWQRCDDKQRQMWKTIATAVRNVQKRRYPLLESLQKSKKEPRFRVMGLDHSMAKLLSEQVERDDIELLGSAHSQPVPRQSGDSERLKELLGSDHGPSGVRRR